ncbi:MAG: hypothetical protein U5R49_09590 [Deltaproteobacteria bacterium]|nr:hypothetical protein [Deltaproteobacteria bacterium]
MTWKLRRRGIPYIRSGETSLITRHPARILWRFFQVVRYPENAYYRRAYERLVPGTPQPPPEAGDQNLNGPVSDILGYAVAFHS